ncbi:MAG: DUF1566 domain-containing protein [Candidatus Lokiarchaeota archaeon]|nr:DUF1566 domain-containing protein [Candidatus Lokiarchaeota archaeon]
MNLDFLIFILISLATVIAIAIYNRYESSYKIESFWKRYRILISIIMTFLFTIFVISGLFYVEVMNEDHLYIITFLSLLIVGWFFLCVILLQIIEWIQRKIKEFYYTNLFDNILVIFIVVIVLFALSLILLNDSLSSKRFRSECKYLTKIEVTNMIKNKKFFDSKLNKSGDGFRNEFIYYINQNVIVDSASGLMWKQGDFSEYSEFEGAKNYAVRLHYAGYDDWRLPTLEEAMSLMEPQKNNKGYHINPSFSSKHTWIWTCDQVMDSSQIFKAWIVYFKEGYCDCSNLGVSSCVWTVRSIQPPIE